MIEKFSSEEEWRENWLNEEKKSSRPFKPPIHVETSRKKLILDCGKYKYVWYLP